MNNIIIFYILSSLILLFPLFISQFIGIINVLEKTTVKAPASYVNTSIAKLFVKSLFFKSPTNHINFFILFFLLLTSLLSNTFVWFSIGTYVSFDIVEFYILLLIQITILALYLINHSKRVNITDMFIEYGSFLLMLLVSFSIGMKAKMIGNAYYQGTNYMLLVSIIYLYSQRIEEILAISEYFKKYLLEIFRLSTITVFVFLTLKDFDGISIDLRIFIIVSFPLLFSTFLKVIYDKIINTKNNSVNKYLERWVLAFMNIFLLVGIFL